MAASVELSEKTKKLIHQLTPMMSDNTSFVTLSNSNPERSAVTAWLSESIPSTNKSRFLLESLRASLLEDLHDSFLSPVTRETSRAPVSRLKKAQYTFLAIAGTLLAICEGFDGIASILTSFAAVPVAGIFAAGLIFSALSVGIFYGFELYGISQQVGVGLGKTGQLLDVFLEQVEQIKKIRKIIDQRFADESIKESAEREELRSMINMLIRRYNALDNDRQRYFEKLKNPFLQLARLITAGLTSLIFFSGGFFAGQTLALTVAGLFVASAAATFWPIFLASTVVGLAALSLYWFVQRPGLEHLVSHWVGLDKSNIVEFGDRDIVAHQKDKLKRLLHKLDRVEELRSNATDASQVQETHKESEVQEVVSPDSEEALGANRHSLFGAPCFRGRLQGSTYSYDLLPRSESAMSNS